LNDTRTERKMDARFDVEGERGRRLFFILEGTSLIDNVRLEDEWCTSETVEEGRKMKNEK